MTDTPTPTPVDLTPEVLAWWEELAEKATPGPWKAHEPDNPEAITYTVYVSGKGYFISGAFQEDAEFVAAARTAVPALVAGVRSRDARIAELEAVIAEASKLAPWAFGMEEV